MDWDKKHDELERLLIKTPLEPYTKEIEGALGLLASNIFVIVNRIEERREWHLKVAQFSRALLAILNNEEVKVGGNVVTDEWVLSALKTAMIQEYKRMGLHWRYKTFEEAQEELENWRNDESVKEWIREALEEVADEEGLIGEEKYLSAADFDAFCDEHSNVEYFAEFEKIEVEVSPEEVEAAIKAHNIGAKKGRSQKNQELQWFVLELRKHYKKQSNEIYRLLFDSLDLYGLIDAEVKKAWHWKNEKELSAAKTSYMKAVYKNALKLESPHDPILDYEATCDLRFWK